LTEHLNDLEKQALAIWSKSFLSRYEHWKKKDLFAIALQTMPKQVKTENVIDNLIRLKATFAQRLENEC
jgi:hypothetical protein